MAFHLICHRKKIVKSPMSLKNCYKYVSVFLVFFFYAFIFWGEGVVFYIGVIFLYFLPFCKIEKILLQISVITYFESPGFLNPGFFKPRVFKQERSTFIMIPNKQSSRRGKSLLDLWRVQELKWTGADTMSTGVTDCTGTGVPTFPDSPTRQWWKGTANKPEGRTFFRKWMNEQMNKWMNT